MMYAWCTHIYTANNIAIYHIFQQYFTCSNHEFAINIHILFMTEIKYYCVIKSITRKEIQSFLEFNSLFQNFSNFSFIHTLHLVRFFPRSKSRYFFLLRSRRYWFANEWQEQNISYSSSSSSFSSSSSSSSREEWN